MPKSNDIHFAQPSNEPPDELAGVAQLGARHQLEQPRLEGGQQEQQQAGLRLDWPSSSGLAARTMLSTDSKAMVLALPISPANTFAGFEPGK